MFKLQHTASYETDTTSVSSTVDYFAKFSQHAFENTAQNFYMQVVLQNSSEQGGAKEIRCAASFTIRRDVFDLVGASPCTYRFT